VFILSWFDYKLIHFNFHLITIELADLANDSGKSPTQGVLDKAQTQADPTLRSVNILDSLITWVLLNFHKRKTLFPISPTVIENTVRNYIRELPKSMK